MRRTLAFLFLLPLIYLAAGAIGGAIPRNPGWAEAEDGVTVYVATNGVHTGLVLPTRGHGVDWSGLIRPEHIRDARYAGYYLWFGWGERDFYLNTPTWAELSPRVALRAAIGSPATLMHVDHIVAPWEDARPVRLSLTQYRALAQAIRASFDARDPRPIRGYDVADAFYPARGRYSAIRTCNQWTSDMLAAAGVRVGAWTPTSATVMQWF